MYVITLLLPCVVHIQEFLYCQSNTMEGVFLVSYILSFIHLTKSKFGTMIVECTISIVTLGGEGRKGTPENAVTA